MVSKSEAVIAELDTLSVEEFEFERLEEFVFERLEEFEFERFIEFEFERLEEFEFERFIEFERLEEFELERFIELDTFVRTEVGKSDPDVILTALVITVVLRGSPASVIVPSLSTYNTVGTPDTGFCAAIGVLL